MLIRANLCTLRPPTPMAIIPDINALMYVNHHLHILPRPSTNNTNNSWNSASMDRDNQRLVVQPRRDLTSLKTGKLDKIKRKQQGNYENAEYSSGLLKKGSKGVCALWSVAGLAKTEKRKARADKTKGSKRYVIARGWWMDDLDTGEKLLIYAFPQSSSAFHQFPCHLPFCHPPPACS